MKKSYHWLACFILLSMSLRMRAMAAAADPFLTNASSETFDLDMGGLTLSLPIELRERAVSKKINELQTDLSIGNIDFSYDIVDSKTSSSKTIKAWVEFEAGSSRCDVDKNIANIQNNLLNSEKKSRIKRLVNANFDGYIVTTETANRGKFKGLYLEVYDKKISVCYTISLAIDNFEEATKSEIRKALSPLTNPLKKSLVEYSLKGAAQ